MPSIAYADVGNELHPLDCLVFICHLMKVILTIVDDTIVTNSI